MPSESPSASSSTPVRPPTHRHGRVTLPGSARSPRGMCFTGKVLDDAKTVAEIDIKEKDFVVVMFAVRPFHNYLAPRSKVASLTIRQLTQGTAPCLVFVGLQKVKPAPKAAPAAAEPTPAAAAPAPPSTPAPSSAAASSTSEPAVAAAATDAAPAASSNASFSAFYFPLRSASPVVGN